MTAPKASSLFLGRGFNRREILRTTAGAGAAMLAASHVPSFAQENTAKPGGRFRVAIGQAHTSDNLDPSRVATNFQINIQYALRN